MNSEMQLIYKWWGIYNLAIETFLELIFDLCWVWARETEELRTEGVLWRGFPTVRESFPNVKQIMLPVLSRGCGLYQMFGRNLRYCPILEPMIDHQAERPRGEDSARATCPAKASALPSALHCFLFSRGDRSWKFRFFTVFYSIAVCTLLLKKKHASQMDNINMGKYS